MPYKLLPPGTRGPYWYIRGKIAGRRREVSTGEATREGAESWAAEYVAALHRHAVPVASDAVTFAQAAHAFIAYKRPQLDDERLILALAAWFDLKPIRGLTHAHLVDAARALRPRGGNATRNRKVIGPAAAVLHYAADQGWCEYRRFKKFAVPRKSSRECGATWIGISVIRRLPAHPAPWPVVVVRVPMGEQKPDEPAPGHARDSHSLPSGPQF